MTFSFIILASQSHSVSTTHYYFLFIILASHAIISSCSVSFSEKHISSFTVATNMPIETIPIETITISVLMVKVTGRIHSRYMQILKRKSCCEKIHLLKKMEASFLSIPPHGMEKEGMDITDMIFEPRYASIIL